MSRQHASNWQLFIFLNLLFTVGSVCSALSQPLPKPPDTSRSPNPRVIIKYITVARSNDPSKAHSVDSPRLSSSDEKKAAIEQAIQDGNDAREANNYEKALASYRRVAEELNPKDARAVYGLGNVYYDLACTDQAIRAYSDALRLDENFRDASIALGYAYATKENYDEAATQFRSVLKKKSDDVDAKIGLAYAISKKKQYEAAIKELTLVVSNQAIDVKKRAVAYLRLGDIYLEQTKWEEAAVNLKKAIELNADLASAYVKLGQTELFPATSKFSLLVQQERGIEERERLAKAAKKAAEYVRTAINEHHYNHPFGNLLLANALISQFNYQEALSNVDVYFRKVKELEDQSSFLATKCNLGFQQLYAFGHFYRALIYNQQALLEDSEVKRNEYTEKVIENAKRLIAIKEDDPAGYGFLGQVFVSKAQWREAIEPLEKSILFETNESSKGSSYALLALCYERLNQDQDATRAYNEALKRRTTDLSARFGLARLQAKEGNFDEAIRLDKEATVGEQTWSASFYWMLGSIYFSKAQQSKNDADYEEAIKLSKKALDVNPSLTAVYLSLGNAYKFYKDGAYVDEALANYEKYESYFPKDAAIKFLIGDLFYSLKKNSDAAINYLRQAIKIKPDYIQAYRELAFVYHDKHQDDLAIEQVLTALRYNPKYLDAYLDLTNLYDEHKNYDAAVGILMQAIDNLPKEYLPYKELARIYSYQHKNEQAVEYYQKAIGLMKPSEGWLRDAFQCRIFRLRGQFAESIACIQNLKIPSSGDPAQIPYELGVTYVASKNKDGARAQYERLKQMKSYLADNLLRQINEMK